MAETLKISVIIPAHNAAGFIQQAIESAAMQPEAGEVIAVDDASTDDTWALLNKLGQSVEKLKIFRLPENQGAGCFQVLLSELWEMVSQSTLLHPCFSNNSISQQL